MFVYSDFHYPTMQNMGEDLVTVLDQLRIKYVIGLGDGAGSNIIVRQVLSTKFVKTFC